MSTPILFLAFSRPQTTMRVLDAIRAARPERLYVAADGPRQDKPGEAERCAEVRRVATQVDWPCEVRTLFRKRNLGCREAVSSAITWFFEQESEGIILEDDTLPTPTFFPFCTELLDRYRHDTRVMSISGASFQDQTVDREASYFFSRYTLFWGWASWRRAWSLYDAKMAHWPAYRDAGMLRAWADGDDHFEKYWADIFDRVSKDEIDTWDYQWRFSCWLNSGLTCQPKWNQVSNIGFGVGATHTHDAQSRLSCFPTRDIEFPLVHPRFCARDVAADAVTHRFIFQAQPESAFRAALSYIKVVPRRLVHHLQGSLYGLTHRVG